MAALLSIILAAGEGTRMKSDLPKVLHPVAGRPIIQHVMAAARGAGAGEIAVVIAPERPDVRRAVTAFDPDAVIYEQRERLGTAHAARMADKSWQSAEGYIAVIYGDHPLLRPDNFEVVLSRLEAGFDAAVLAFEPADPTGYGRLIVDGDRLLDIREHKDATETERQIGLCNACILAFRAEVFRALIGRVGNDNAQNEFYLPDLVPLANAAGFRVTFGLAPESDVMGVNSRAQLAVAEHLFQARLRAAAMDGGATLVDPGTVFLSHDTRIGRDVTIEPFVFIGPGVTIGDHVQIHAHSHIVGATIGNGAEIGPFARLRPEAVLAEDTKVGNFCEVKKSVIGKGAKVNHLTYIGDAEIGENSNIGAGTITCNYDGVNKHRTVIGKGVFVGSNSSLVAPVHVGDGAYVGSGSVITTNVEPGALAIGRARQENRRGYAARLKERALALKASRKKD